MAILTPSRAAYPWRALFVAAALPAMAVGARADARIGVVYGAAARYAQVAETIIQRLEGAGYACQAVALPSADAAAQRAALDPLRAFRPTVVVAGGTTATVQALSAFRDTPVIYFMVPNALDAPFLATNRGSARPAAGVASDVDPVALVAWVRCTHPRASQIAVLCGPRTRRSVAALADAGRTHGIRIHAVPAQREAFPEAIEKLGAQSYDGVLMIPDSDVYSADTVKRLLLWGVRQKKPVWTFTPNVVEAGAFAGIQANLDAVAEKTAALTAEVVAGATPKRGGLQYADCVDRSVNLHTAEMIGIPLDDSSLGADVARLGGSK